MGTLYWAGYHILAKQVSSDWAKPGEQYLEKLGHYLPGTVYFQGEWYWGLDRLEIRLIGASLGQGPVAFDRTYLGVFDPLQKKVGRDMLSLQLFFSGRSPYSYISLFLACNFADSVGLDLCLYPVLPTMMRNMKVPLRKRIYIVTGAKREADKAGLPFGKIADPLGVGIERTYAVAHGILKTNPDMLETHFQSALWGIGSEAIDLATDHGLKRIVQRAGIDWPSAKEALNDPDWRLWVQENRDMMSVMGLWGVPCPQFGDLSVWGQDRFWRIRQEVVKMLR